MTTPTDRVRAALNLAIADTDSSVVRELLRKARRELDGMVLVPVEPTSECTVCGKEIPFTKHRGSMQCQKHSHLSF